MISLSLDSNARVNPIFEETKFADGTLVQRIIDIAIPFLNLWGPTALVTNLALCGNKSFQHTVNCFQTTNIWVILENVFHIALSVTSVALNILLPSVGILFSQSVHLIQDAYVLIQHLNNHEWKESLYLLLDIFYTLLYCASVYFAAPEIILISLLSQIVSELVKGISELNKGNYIEFAASILMMLVRSATLVPKAIDLHREYFGHQVNLEEFINVLKEAKSRDKTLHTLFKEKHYRSTVRNLDLSKYRIEALTIDHLKFDLCNFNLTIFKDSYFNDVQFTKCSLNNFRAVRTVFQNVHFENCSLKNAAFFNSSLREITFKASKLTCTTFNESYLQGVHYQNCKMKETSFLEAKVYKSSITSCDLTDCLLLDTKPHFKIKGGKPHVITKPIIALSWNFETQGRMAGLINEGLRLDGAIPLRYDYTGQDIDPKILDQEIKTALSNAEGAYFSNAKEILETASKNSEVAKIRKKADRIFKYAHALILPGGLDVEPEFYGHGKEPFTETREDYRNTLMDFAAIDIAYSRQLPIMGICRGSQVTNVYFGGTLKQYVDGHCDLFHNIAVHSSAPDHLKQEMQQIIGEDFWGYSHHHQASSRIGKGLHIVIEEDGCPEAIMNDDGSILLTQFHPEFFYLYQKNKEAFAFLEGHVENGRNFFKRMIHLAEEKRLGLSSMVA